VRLPVDASNGFSAVSDISGHHLDHPATLLGPWRSPLLCAAPLLLRQPGLPTPSESLPARGSGGVGFAVSFDR
jgi:hypothetical protein